MYIISPPAPVPASRPRTNAFEIGADQIDAATPTSVYDSTPLTTPSSGLGSLLEKTKILQAQQQNNIEALHAAYTRALTKSTDNIVLPMQDKFDGRGGDAVGSPEQFQVAAAQNAAQLAAANDPYVRKVEGISVATDRQLQGTQSAAQTIQQLQAFIQRTVANMAVPTGSASPAAPRAAAGDSGLVQGGGGVETPTTSEGIQLAGFSDTIGQIIDAGATTFDGLLKTLSDITGNTAPDNTNTSGTINPAQEDPNQTQENLRLKLATDLIYNFETVPGLSNLLYWPKGNSGVTIGAGYDMKFRTPEEIMSTLTSIGVDPDIAAKIAQGAGLSGQDAQNFVRQNQSLLSLTEEQQKQLLSQTMTSATTTIDNLIHTQLTDNQYAALTSLIYNVGRSAFAKSGIPDLINQGNLDAVPDIFSKFIYSGGNIVPALVRRRAAERALFTQPDDPAPQ